MATGEQHKSRPKEAELFDIQDVVEKWAWKQYQDTESGKQRRLRRRHEKMLKKGQECLELTVDWSAVRFVDVTHWPRFVEAQKDNAEQTVVTDESVKTNGLHKDKGSTDTDTDKQRNKPTRADPDVNVLFRTTFTNNTASPQTYTLRTEKTTRSTCETTIEQGYVKGQEFEITIKAPGEVLEANAGFHSELSLNKTEGQTLEEEVTWGVESEITVNAGKCADAKLIVLERKYDDKFTIESRISGNVFARFTNMLDNNSSVKMTQRSIDKIVKDYLKDRSQMNKPVSEQFIKLEGTTVVINTAGTCRFRYGVKQDVRVDERPIEGASQVE